MKRIVILTLAAAVFFLIGWAGSGFFLSRDGDRVKTAPAVSGSQRSDAPEAGRLAAAARENSVAALASLLEEFATIAETGEDLESVLASLRELPSKSLRIASLQLLASELVHLELEEGLELAGELTEAEQNAFLETLFARWNDTHSAESLVRALGESGIASHAAWVKAVAKVSESDPEAAIELVNRFYAAKTDTRYGVNSHSSGSAGIRSRILTEWAKSDPAAAAASWEKQKFAGIVWTRNPIANVWFETDPAAALAWLETAKGNSISYRGYIASLAEESPEKAFDLFQQMPDLLDRPGVPETVAKGWAKKDPQAAIAWLEETVDSPDRIQKAIADMIWSLDDLDTKRALLDRLPEGSNNRLEALRKVAGSWGEEGDVEALAWAKSLGNPRESEKAVFRVLWSWAEEHPELLIEHRQELVDAGIFESEDGQMIMSDLAGSHPELAREWIKVLPEDLQRDSAMGVAWTLAQRSPRDGADFVDSLPDAVTREKAAQRVAAIWARSDPRAAAEWVEAIPEGVGRDFAFGNLINTWSRHEPAAAEAWLSAQAPSPSRDRAAAEFVKITAWLDPEKALKWAATIEDEKSGNNSLREALKPWARRDPEAASAAITNLPVPSDVREELEAFVVEAKVR